MPTVVEEVVTTIEELLIPLALKLNDGSTVAVLVVMVGEPRDLNPICESVALGLSVELETLVLQVGS